MLQKKEFAPRRETAINIVVRKDRDEAHGEIVHYQSDESVRKERN